MHGLLVTGALWWKPPEEPKAKRVVPIEAITLTRAGPGSAGGGGSIQAAEPSNLSADKPQPAPPKPAPKEKIRPKPKPRPKSPEMQAKPREIQPPPPPALAMPGPPLTADERSGSLPSGRVQAESGNTAGAAGKGRSIGAGAGSGGGAGTGKGIGRGSGHGADGSLLGNYLREIRKLLERHKNYPRQARLLRQEGVAVLQFTISSAGQVQGVRLSRSSGHELLDQAAQETLRRVGHFPPFPQALGRERLTVEIPLAYRLR
ncbi:MAG: energy transducer TonB [Deltaproteobacteria bacterium]|nr:energy transducer TonB [Deltaproteobacteria bacterium]